MSMSVVHFTTRGREAAGTTRKFRDCAELAPPLIGSNIGESRSCAWPRQHNGAASKGTCGRADWTICLLWGGTEAEVIAPQTSPTILSPCTTHLSASPNPQGHERRRLSLPLTCCNTQESRPCILLGQQSRTDPSGGGTVKLTQGPECKREGSVGLGLISSSSSLSSCNSLENWP